MAHKVPVIASRVGGLPEVVRHGVGGYLEPLGDVQAMAEDVLTLLRDPRLRRTMGESAQGRALTTSFAEGPRDRPVSPLRAGPAWFENERGPRRPTALEWLFPAG